MKIVKYFLHLFKLIFKHKCYCNYKPLTDVDVINIIIKKYDIMKMKKRDVSKCFKKILNENDKKLSELLSKINFE